MAAEQSGAMASASDPTTTTFDDLSYDCILLILDEIQKLPGEGWNCPKNIKNLSLVNKHLRQLCMPLLFTSDKLSLGRCVPELKTLQALSTAPFVVSKLLAFKIELFDNTEPQPTSAFCDSFVNALVAMPKLSELNLNLGDQSKSISTLGKAFKSSNATLPTIQTLELRAAPKAAFILKACPSLKTFIAFHIEKGWKSTFAPLPSMETIRQVEIDTSQNWTLRRLQELLPFVKNVPEICLKGELYKEALSAFAPFFKELKSLEALSMTTTQWVNTKNLSKFYCDDRLLDAIEYEQEDHYLNEAPEKVARDFFAACPSLLTFSPLYAFGGPQFTCERKDADADGDTIKKVYVRDEVEGIDSYGFPTTFGLFSGFY